LVAGAQRVGAAQGHHSTCRGEQPPGAKQRFMHKSFLLARFFGALLAVFIAFSAVFITFAASFSTFSARFRHVFSRFYHVLITFSAVFITF
jgi:hypothetical protein